MKQNLEHLILVVSEVVKKIPRILWNPKVYYHPFVLILRHTNLGHVLPTDFFKIHSNIILPFTSRSSSWSFPLRFPQRLGQLQLRK